VSYALILILIGVAVCVWRISRLLIRGKVDVLFSVKAGPSSVGPEHPLFWAHVIVLLALTAVGLFLAIALLGG
jgi:hypothetical protein